MGRIRLVIADDHLVVRAGLQEMLRSQPDFEIVGEASNGVKELYIQVVDKLMMIMVVVSDMPKAKAFYADKLGLKVTTGYRQDDDNCWVSLTPIRSRLH